MGTEDDRPAGAGEPPEAATDRAERLRLARERQVARQTRRRSDRQFLGVLLIFAVLFFAVGIVLARTIWRPKPAPAAESPAPPATTDPAAGTPAAASNPTSETAAASDEPAYRIEDREPIPYESKAAFVQHMKAWRHEEDKWLNARWERYQACVELHDLTQPRVKQAFLATPRQLFCREWNLPRAYVPAFLDLGHGYGVTISGPNIVCRMTNALNPQPEQRCLEIGTGSGYQAAILANLSDHVYSIEIIKGLAQETKELYDKLIAEGYDEYKNVHLKAADGYYGWKEHAPFDRIIVTCGIDHVPPDLIKQLAPNGIMIIPIGTPGAQRVKKITKKVSPDGQVDLPQEDLYPNRTGTQGTTFVPFTAEGGGDHFRR
jgi:protein-L-isoaspartate(D-aspartate) O-methyltransferase